jgi:N-methylhydantoinase A
MVYLDGAMQEVPVHERRSLGRGDELHGPAVVEEQSSCVIFKRGQVARVDDAGNLRISL